MPTATQMQARENTHDVDVRRAGPQCRDPSAQAILPIRPVSVTYGRPNAEYDVARSGYLRWRVGELFGLRKNIAQVACAGQQWQAPALHVV